MNSDLFIRLKCRPGYLRFIFAMAFVMVLQMDAIAQSNFQRVRINQIGVEVIENLLGLGIDLHCGASKVLDESNQLIALDLDLSDAELAMLSNAGQAYSVIIPNLSQYYQDRNAAYFPGLAENIAAPDNFYINDATENGGFFTNDQIIQHLDDMRSLYPALVAPKTSIGTTFEGRPIYSIKISDNPIFDEAEPEVFYNAAHHAREPMSVSQLIFFMWYLLENYDSDQRIKGILDNTELFFVPIINVDGYVYNETSNPEGGGNWRKNRRDNGDGSIGVDLNRNYSYEWSFNDLGSSSNPSASTFRGPAPFSEPESQAVRDFVRSRQFKLAFNYHSAASLFIHPWSYDPAGVVADPIFTTISEYFSEENDFGFGPGPSVLYQNNGNAYDWMYGSNGVFAYTVETGPNSGGFWPDPSTIIPSAEEMLESNIRMAELASPFAELANRSASNQLLPGGMGSVDFELNRLGIDQGELTVAALLVSGPAGQLCASQTYASLNHGEIRNGSCPFVVNSDAQQDDIVEIRISVSNDLRELRSFVATFRVREPGLDITLLSPTTGSFPAGESFRVSARILSDQGVAATNLFVNGISFGSLSPEEPGSEIYIGTVDGLSDGQHSFIVSAEDELGYQTISQTETVFIGGLGSGAFQESNGFVILEAENFDQNIERGNDTWELHREVPGYAGSGTMITGPSNGTKVITGYETTTPELQYEIQFSTVGTYYLWYRGFGINTGENSVHFGIDDAPLSSLQDVGFSRYRRFVWTSIIDDGSRAQFTIGTPGLHTLNMWMREDGTQIDRIILTQDPSYVPSSLGPAESPKQTGQVVFNAKAFLSGPYESGEMNTDLSEKAFLPEFQPYANLPATRVIPGYFSDREDVVDWVQFEFRSELDAGSVLARGVGLITKNGQVVDAYGNENIVIFGLDPGQYYFVLRHRNHLPVMTSATLDLNPDLPAQIDFTTDLATAFTNNGPALESLSDGFFALWKGDAGGDGQVSYSGASNDRVEILNILSGPSPFSFEEGYLIQDLNLDGRVSYSGARNDRVAVLESSGGPTAFDVRTSQVPD